MSEKNYNFQKLTPVNDIELKIYKDALDFVFDNDDIKNVAISGAYGAGKSSLLESYKTEKKKNKVTEKDLTFIHISLAHFEALTQDKSEPGKNREAVLEGKILNQLIHQIDPKKIPQTYFKVKQETSQSTIFNWTALITAFLICTSYIVGYSKWSNFVSACSKPWLKTVLSFTTGNMVLVFGVLFMSLCGFTIFSLIKAQTTKHIFKKVKLQEYEIEVLDENDATYFDKYLNEVLYLFKNCGADAIVFEDMDRYNVSQIFVKLREVNTLVNKKVQKPIRFLYLLRDDIFESKGRTKFFDFIIPVVPVIDCSNSYDKFIDCFKKGNIFDLFNEKFLKDLSLYIDDMRILKNIFNEFQIYHNQVQSIELDNNKLLALIVYKNIFPRDFSELQLGIGFVNTIFNSKSNVIKTEMQNVELQIHNTEEKIQSVKNEFLKTINELDAVYLPFNFQIHNIGGKNVSVYDTRAKIMKAMKENPDSIQGYTNARFGPLSPEFDTLAKNSEYNQRKAVIENNSGKRLNDLKEELKQLNHKKVILEISKIQKLITRDNVDSVFSVTYENGIGEKFDFKGIRGSLYFPLIKYLIRNGHIDETYPDYMTYFYENSLSRIDKIFLRSITDEIPKGYSYSLKDPKLILSRLRLIDFDHEEILNFHLLEYLLENGRDYKQFLTRFLEQLKSTGNFKFIGEFLDANQSKGVFIRTINDYWPEMFASITDKSAFSEEQKKQYVIDTFCFSPANDLKNLNINNCMSDFISSTPSFLGVANPDVQKISAGLSLFEIKFAWIEHNVSNEDLFLAVYKNNQYKLTFELICLILEKIYKLANNADFKHCNYTLISSKPDEHLSLYIHDHINDYLSIVFENCDKCIKDDESAALQILNNKDVADDNKKRYIEYLQTIIDDVNDVVDYNYWRLLLEHNRITYTAKNVLDYFYHPIKGLEQITSDMGKIFIDSQLIDFINSNTIESGITFDLIHNEYGENIALLFYRTIIKCNKLSDLKYEQFFSAFKRMYPSFEYKGISDTKVLILIKYNCIQMNAENLIFMRANYPDQLRPFITKNIKKYAEEIIDKETFSADEMLYILDENVDNTYKIKLLPYFSGNISLQNKTYSDVVKIHVLNNKFEINDMLSILESYPNECKEVKDVIKTLTTKHVEDVIIKKLAVPYELLSILLQEEQLSILQKKSLFVLCLQELDEEQVKSALQAQQMDDFLSLFDGKQPKLEKNDLNEKILEIFKGRNWITSYDPDKDDSNSYRAYGRKTEEKVFS
jgi:hypothetical protein